MNHKTLQPCLSWAALLLATAVLVLGVGSPSASARSASPAAAVGDGFAFLPPLGPKAAAAGPVAEWLLPFLHVQVCVWDGSSCGDAVADLSAAGTGTARLSLKGKGKPSAFFQGTFKTKAKLAEGTSLRLRVLVGPAIVGFRDLVVHAKGPLGGDPYVVRQKGGVKIAFRILQEPFWGGLPGLTSDPASAPAGGSVALSTPAAVGSDAALELQAGGQPGSVLRAADGFTAGVPLFIGKNLLPQPPSTPVDLLLFADGTPVAAGHQVLRVTPLAPAPGSAQQAVQDLGGIADSVSQIGQTLSDGPSLQEQWLVSLPQSLDELINGSDPHSLAGALAAASPQERTLLEAWLKGSGALDFLTQFDDVLAQAADALGAGDIAHARALLASARRMSSLATPTSVSDDELARKMQFYAVVRLFGDQVIGQTNRSWSTVGNIAGALALVRSIPAAAAISAILGVADFVINKLFVGLLPAKISSLDLQVAKTKLDPGEKTNATLMISAANDPPQVGFQDMVGAVLNLLGAGETSKRTEVVQAMEDIASYFLNLLQSNLSAYAAQFPQLGLGDLYTSVPTMTWQAQVTDHRLIQGLSTNAGIIDSAFTEVNWIASSVNTGEARIWAHTSDTGPDLIPGLGYNGGAFGDNSADSNQVPVRIGPITVTVSPGFADLSPGGQQQFTATVTNASNTDVTWSAASGTIDASGNYTAPSSTGTDTITATSVEDTTVTGTATVQIRPKVTVTPATVSLGPGDQQQFTATVVGATDPSVTWSATAGTIDQNGNYTAPQGNGTYTITATSVEDPTSLGNATVTVGGLNVQFLSPPAKVAVQSPPVDFCVGLSDGGAPVAGETVNWQLLGNGSLSGSTSLTDSLGKACISYTPPQFFDVGETATIQADATHDGAHGQASTTFGFKSGPRMRITPPGAEAFAGDTVPFQAEVVDPGTGNVISTNVAWSTTDGQITQQGVLTVPNSPGTTVTVTATWIDDPNVTGSAGVEVDVLGKIVWIGSHAGGSAGGGACGLTSPHGDRCDGSGQERPPVEDAASGSDAFSGAFTGQCDPGWGDPSATAGGNGSGSYSFSTDPPLVPEGEVAAGTTVTIRGTGSGQANATSPLFGCQGLGGGGGGVQIRFAVVGGKVPVRLSLSGSANGSGRPVDAISGFASLDGPSGSSLDIIGFSLDSQGSDSRTDTLRLSPGNYALRVEGNVSLDADDGASFSGTGSGSADLTINP